MAQIYRLNWWYVKCRRMINVNIETYYVFTINYITLILMLFVHDKKIQQSTQFHDYTLCNNKTTNYYKKLSFIINRVRKIAIISFYIKKTIILFIHSLRWRCFSKKIKCYRDWKQYSAWMWDLLYKLFIRLLVGA